MTGDAQPVRLLLLHQAGTTGNRARIRLTPSRRLVRRDTLTSRERFMYLTSAVWFSARGANVGFVSRDAPDVGYAYKDHVRDDGSSNDAIMNVHVQRGVGRGRIVAAILALIAAMTSVVALAGPAAADPPYAKPNLKVLSCGVFDDPVDYGDGIDWWKFRFTYTNSGLIDTRTSFNVRVQWVWTATGGNETTANFVQPGLARGAHVTREFWVTQHVAVAGLASVWLDSDHDVDEYGFESDNLCSTHQGW
ncbi:hypothetical protein [Dactylosporangium sp. NPDC050588]|uniref:hypothetical protein n=1 Tax=Dactylosporangium sp. NPDC050588 TaxID=3157211 RepID=UPI0033DE3C2D